MKRRAAAADQIPPWLSFEGNPQRWLRKKQRLGSMEIFVWVPDTTQNDRGRRILPEEGLALLQRNRRNQAAKRVTRSVIREAQDDLAVSAFPAPSMATPAASSGGDLYGNPSAAADFAPPSAPAVSAAAVPETPSAGMFGAAPMGAAVGAPVAEVPPLFGDSMAAGSGLGVGVGVGAAEEAPPPIFFDSGLAAVADPNMVVPLAGGAGAAEQLPAVAGDGAAAELVGDDPPIWPDFLQGDFGFPG